MLKDPKGEHEISFTNNAVDYLIYQIWKIENIYEIGIIAIDKNKIYKIPGTKSQTGSLSRLDKYKHLLTILQ